MTKKGVGISRFEYVAYPERVEAAVEKGFKAAVPTAIDETIMSVPVGATGKLSASIRAKARGKLRSVPTIGVGKYGYVMNAQHPEQAHFLDFGVDVFFEEIQNEIAQAFEELS